MAGSDSTSGMMNRLASTTAIASIAQPSRHETTATFSGSAANENPATAIPAIPMTSISHSSRFASRCMRANLNPAWS